MAEKQKPPQEVRQSEFFTEAKADRTGVRKTVKLPKGTSLLKERKREENNWLSYIHGSSINYQKQKCVIANDGFIYAILDTRVFTRFGGSPGVERKPRFGESGWVEQKLDDGDKIVRNTSVVKGKDNIREIIENHQKDLRAKHGGAVLVVQENSKGDYYFHFYDAGAGYRGTFR
jgi:hypothetical protein